jgi:hypothetical protein
MDITLLEGEISGHIPNYSALAEAFPEMTTKILARVGFLSGLRLYEETVSGGKITYRDTRTGDKGWPLSKSGRGLVKYHVNKRNKSVSITSFPLNLFEKGRRLRDGTREAGRHIMRDAEKTLPVKEYAADALGIVMGEKK